MKKKHILFILAFCSLNLVVKAQGYRDLGQTKSYLMKLNEHCYISLNSENFLIVRCENLYSEFLFDEKTNLCNLKAFELPLSMKADLLEGLIKDNFKYVKDVGFPAYTLVNGTFESRNALSKMYVNNTYVVTVLESSLMGIDENLFGVVYEPCNEANGCK
jgi:hypothetical protein